MSPLNDLVFATSSELPAMMQGLTQDELQRVVDHLKGVAVLLDQARPHGPDAALLLDELRWTQRILTWAAHRGLDYLQHRLNEVRLQRRSEGIHLIAQHERQWVARNRIGGLHESSGRLRAVLASL